MPPPMPLPGSSPVPPLPVPPSPAPPRDEGFLDGYLRQSAAAVQRCADDPAFRATLAAMAERVAASLRAGGKLLVCGNGGSAADAQHLAAEFVGRMLYDRPSLPAIALTTDGSALTAIANDYGFEAVFARQVAGLGRPGDVLLGISTSGRSANVLRALAAAKAGGMTALAFAGQDAGPMRDHADWVLQAPARPTPVVQQVHIMAAHLLVALVERALHPRPDEQAPDRADAVAPEAAALVAVPDAVAPAKAAPAAPAPPVATAPAAPDAVASAGRRG